jgi:branched-chain amino acid aminotransferase
MSEQLRQQWPAIEEAFPPMTEQKLQEQKEQGTPARETPKYLWRSGELVEWESATVHVSMLGWTAVSAIFEGIRAYWNPDRQELYIFRLDDHLKRMLQSMKLMRMASPYSTEDLAQAIISLLRDNEYRRDVYIQPLAYFGEGIPGYMAVLERPGEVVITARPAPSGLGESKVSHCNVSSWTRISDNVMPPRAKAISNYQNSRYVSTESKVNGYDYGIILNQQGKVAEASYACIFIVRDGVAFTPPVSAGILESITRETVRELLEREMGVPVVERDVERTELYVADEIFLCGTAVEVQPVVSVDRYRVGSGETGPVVSRLESLFHQVVRGNHSDYTHWLGPVYHQS